MLRPQPVASQIPIVGIQMTFGAPRTLEAVPSDCRPSAEGG